MKFQEIKSAMFFLLFTFIIFYSPNMISDSRSKATDFSDDGIPTLEVPYLDIEEVSTHDIINIGDALSTTTEPKKKTPKKKTTPACYCGDEYKKVECKSGNNAGRFFLTCANNIFNPESEKYDGGCKVFKWEDEERGKCGLCFAYYGKLKNGEEKCFNWKCKANPPKKSGIKKKPTSHVKKVNLSE